MYFYSLLHVPNKTSVMEKKIEKVCFFSLPEREESAVSTIVIRGATDNIMDDIERAIDDGVNTFKALTKVGRIVHSNLVLSCK